jgi:oxygen-independent coproporphyrinogen-3 oxidase
MSSHFINTLLTFIYSCFPLSEKVEISIETNPRDISPHKCEAWFNAGINRISIGVQSFDLGNLNVLGRDHSQADVYNAFECLEKFRHFRSISADLIFAIPGQSLEGWCNELEIIQRLPVEHISVYGLKIEESTALGDLLDKDVLKLPTEDEYVEMYKSAQNILPQTGFAHYEISNFAKRGHECAHNLAYWRNLDYLGLGAAAHSHVNGVRWNFKSNNADYFSAFSQPLLEQSLRFLYCFDNKKINNELIDTIFMGMRLADGINCSDLKEKFHYDLLAEKHDEIVELCDCRLLDIKENRLFITPAGYLVSNAIILRLIADLS